MSNTNNTKQTGYSSNKNNRSYKNPRQQPCRGFPAIFFTCESGREKKCQREALSLIHHYYYLSKSDKSASDNKEAAKADSSSANDEPLSLDEELKMLRKGAAAEEVLNYERSAKRPRHEAKGAKSMKSPFVVHDNGMKGIVSIVYSVAGSEVVPYNEIVESLRPKEKSDDKDGSSEDQATQQEKVVQVANSCEAAEATSELPTWDPVETVRIILKEVGGSKSESDKSTEETNAADKNISTSPPGSRFILRMIPIQATVSQ